MHVCLECSEVYEKQFLPKEDDDGFTICPKSSCAGGDIVELDELIAPAIILLNQKGYFTKYCCSGHWYNPYSPYIYFESGFEPVCEPPKDFTWEFVEKDNGNTIMRAHHSDDINNHAEKYEWVYKINKNLYEWADNLPVREFI